MFNAIGTILPLLQNMMQDTTSKSPDTYKTFSDHLLGFHTYLQNNAFQTGGSEFLHHCYSWHNTIKQCLHNEINRLQKELFQDLNDSKEQINKCGLLNLDACVETSDLTQETIAELISTLENILQTVDQKLQEINQEQEKETHNHEDGENAEEENDIFHDTKANNPSKDELNNIKPQTNKILGGLKYLSKLFQVQENDYWKKQKPNREDHLKFTKDSIELLTGEKVKETVGMVGQSIGAPIFLKQVDGLKTNIKEALGRFNDTVDTKTGDILGKVDEFNTNTQKEFKTLNDTLKETTAAIVHNINDINASVSGNPLELSTLINRLQCLYKCIGLKLQYKDFEICIKDTVCNESIYNDTAWVRKQLNTLKNPRPEGEQLNDNESKALKEEIANSLELIIRDLRSTKDDLCIEYHEHKDIIEQNFNACIASINYNDNEIDLNKIEGKISNGLTSLYKLRNQCFNTTQNAFTGVAKTSIDISEAAVNAKVFFNSTGKVLPGTKFQFYFLYGVGWGSCVAAAIILLNANLNNNLLCNFTLDNKFVIIVGVLLLISICAFICSSYSKVKFLEDSHQSATFRAALIAIPTIGSVAALAIILTRIFLPNVAHSCSIHYHNIPAESIILGIICAIAGLALMAIGFKSLYTMYYSEKKDNSKGPPENVAVHDVEQIVEVNALQP